MNLGKKDQAEGESEEKKDQAKYKLKFKVNFRAPENLLIFGKSGDSGRLNNDEVVGQCDPLVEREVRGEKGIKKATPFERGGQNNVAVGILYPIGETPSYSQ